MLRPLAVQLDGELAAKLDVGSLWGLQPFSKVSVKIRERVGSDNAAR